MKIIAGLMSLLPIKLRQFNWSRLRSRIAAVYHKPLYRLVALFSAGYLACIILFAGAYSLSDSGFNVGDKPASLSLFDSAYFSVVTITSLGYGEITPVSVGMKAIVMAEVIIGLLLIGLFLTQLSIAQSKILSDEQQERSEAVDTRRRDRLQFPTYVAVIKRLSKYVDSYTCPWMVGDGLASFDVHTFGPHIVLVRESFIADDFLNGRGRDRKSEVNPEFSEEWAEHMRGLSVDLRALFEDSSPPISDEKLLTQYIKVQRILQIADLQFPYEDRINEEITAEILVDRRLEMLRGVISEIEMFRQGFLDRATEHPENGESYGDLSNSAWLDLDKMPYRPSDKFQI